MLKLIITHSTLNINAEKRYSPDMTVGELKQKLEMVVGTNPTNMILQHRNENNEVLCTLQPDNLKIGKFDLSNYSNIHVVDTEPNSGIMAQIGAMQNGQNVNVPKYEISEDAYKKRDNTFAKWKEKNLKEFYQKKEDDEKKQMQEWDQILKDKNIKMNDRCQMSESKSKHRGKIAFIGSTLFDQKGVWIGIELDEPYGQHNGTVKGKQYFKCNDKYGVFVRPNQVDVGDFPVIDELEMSDDDGEEL
eukprot:260266_1